MANDPLETLLSAWRTVQERWEPRVLVLAAESGVGKTYHVQRFYDHIASDPAQSYWLPGLLPSETPDSYESLSKARKRIVDSQLCKPLEVPDWLWLGVPCGGAPPDPLFSDPSEGWLARQLEFHVGALDAKRRLGRYFWKGARQAAWGMAQLIPTVGLAGAGATTAGGFRKMLSVAPEDVADIGEDLVVERRERNLELLHGLATSSVNHLPIVVVLDDAHEAKEATLQFLAAALSKGGKFLSETATQEWSYFEPATYPERVPLLVVATVWPHRLVGGQTSRRGFARWICEIEETGISCDVLSENNTFPLLSRKDAKNLLESHHPWLSEERVAKLLIRPEVSEGFSPYLVMWYAAQLEESFALARDSDLVSDLWIEELPTKPVDTARERFRNLPRAGQCAAVLGALLGIEFPVAAVISALAGESRSFLDHEVSAGIEEAVRQNFLTSAETLTGWQAQQEAERGPFWLLRFSEDFPYRFSLTDGLKIYPWISARLQMARREFLVSAMCFLAHDISAPERTVPIFEVHEFIWNIAEKYLQDSSSKDTPDLRLFCLALEHRVEYRARKRGTEVTESGDLMNAIARELEAGRKNLSLGYLWAVSTATQEAFFKRSLGIVEKTFGCNNAIGFLQMRAKDFFEMAPQSRLSVMFANYLVELLDPHRLPSEAVDILRMNAGVNPFAASGLARALERRGKVTEAIEVLRPLSESNPSIASKLSSLLEQSGRREEAVEVLGAFAETSVVIVSQLSSLLERNGREDEAMDVLRPFAESNGTIASQLSKVLERKGMGEQAIEVVRSLAESNAAAASRLASLLDRTGKVEEAIDLLSPFAKSNPTIASQVSALLERVGRRGEAIDLLSPFAKTNGTIASTLSALLEREGRREEAIEILRLFAKTNRNNASQLSNLLEADGRRVEAIEVLRPLAEFSGLIASQLSKFLEQEGHESDAMEVVRPLAKVDPAAASRMAYLLEREGRTVEAIGLLQPFARTNGPLASQLSSLLEQEGRNHEAIRMLFPLVAAHPDHVAVRLADLLEKEGRKREAIEVLTPLVAASPDHVAVRVADLLERDGRSQEAIEVLTPLVAASPNHVAVRMADILERNGRSQEAVEILTPLAGASPHVAIRLADLLVAAGRNQEAVQVLTPLAAASPDHVAIRLADLLEQAGSEQEAIQVLAPLATASPDHVAVRLADLLEKEGRNREAIEILTPLAKASDIVRLRLSSSLIAEGQLEGALELLTLAARRNLAAAIKLAIYAADEERCSIAQALLEEKLTEPQERVELYIQISLTVWSSRALFRVLPKESKYLDEFYRFLRRTARSVGHSNNWHAAGLAALVAEEAFADRLEEAAVLLSTFAKRNAYCASILSGLPEDYVDSDFVLECLILHAVRGNLNCIFRLAKIAIATGSDSLARDVLKFFSKTKRSISGENMDLLLQVHSVAATDDPPPRFGFLRELARPEGSVKLFELLE